MKDLGLWLELTPSPPLPRSKTIGLKYVMVNLQNAYWSYAHRLQPISINQEAINILRGGIIIFNVMIGNLSESRWSPICYIILYHNRIHY